MAELAYRYRYDLIVARIEDAVTRSGKPLKEIQAIVKIPKDQWSRKMTVNEMGTGGKKASFTYPELTRIAHYFGAPEGWPFMDWTSANANERALGVLPPQPKQAEPVPQQPAQASLELSEIKDALKTLVAEVKAAKEPPRKRKRKRGPGRASSSSAKPGEQGKGRG